VAGHACWPGAPGGGRDAAWAARIAGWNPIGQEDRDARSPGEQEARLAASLRSSGIAGDLARRECRTIRSLGEVITLHGGREWIDAIFSLLDASGLDAY